MLLIRIFYSLLIILLRRVLITPPHRRIEVRRLLLTSSSPLPLISTLSSSPFPILFGSTIGMSTDRKLLLISPVRHPSPPLIYSTSIPICLPDPLPLVTVVFTSLNETSEAVIGSSVSSPSHLEP